MYKILVLSDIHGDKYNLHKAIDSNLDVNAILFLGDGLRDWDSLDDFPQRIYTSQVRGNNDYGYTNCPLLAMEIFEDKKIYMTHGHKENVKYGLKELEAFAQAAKTDIVLYGHTHIPYTYYKDGIHYMNPGSVRENSCGIIELHKNGILCYTKLINQMNSDSLY